MKSWFKMSAKGGVGEIMIYDMIGRDWWTGEGVTAKDFDRELKALGDVSEISLRVNSPGGDVFDGVAIFNAIKSHPAKVTAYVDGIAASAASFIVMAADEIVMPENSFMLIHEPRTVAWGVAADFIAAAADLERMNMTFSNTYATRSGTDVEAVRAIMAEDRLMDATEALSLGFADRTSEPVKMAASYDLGKLPESARAKIQAAMSVDLEQLADDAQAAADAAQDVADAAGEAAKDDLAEDAQENEMKDANVVALDSARDGGIAYAQEVADICLLAGMPEKTPEMIAGKKPIADIRSDLLTARAALAQKTEISNHRAVTQKPAGTVSAWEKVIAKCNSQTR